MKHLTKIFLIGLLVCSMLLSGCFEKEPEPKEFSAEGMTITLNDSFSERESDTYTVSYIAPKVVVYAMREAFDSFVNPTFASKTTVVEYAEDLVESNELDAEVKTVYGLTSFIYTRRSKGEEYTFYTAVYKTEDAFWHVQFATKTDSFNELFGMIEDFAYSVTFS